MPYIGYITNGCNYSLPLPTDLKLTLVYRYLVDKYYNMKSKVIYICGLGFETLEFWPKYATFLPFLPKKYRRNSDISYF